MLWQRCRYQRPNHGCAERCIGTSATEACKCCSALPMSVCCTLHLACVEAPRLSSQPWIVLYLTGTSSALQVSAVYYGVALLLHCLVPAALAVKSVQAQPRQPGQACREALYSLGALAERPVYSAQTATSMADTFAISTLQVGTDTYRAGLRSQLICKKS